MMNALWKRKLLTNPKSFPSFLIRSIFHQYFLHHYHTKSPHPRARKNEDKIRIAEKDPDKNLYLNKSKGQHLLTNPRILDAIVRKSAINPTDTVLEIGPGTGNLTLRLLEVAKKVVAVEIDKRMVEILDKRVSEHGFRDKLDIISEDALKTKFPQFDLVVANIPYGISSPLVIKLVYGANSFRSITLLLQKEFARRLVAKPGESEYNRLAVNVKLVAEVEFVMDVSKRDFVPCPKVDSSVVIIRPKSEIPNVNLDEWRAFTRTCFGQKNKTLGAIFKQKKKVLELLRLSKIKMRSESEHLVSDCAMEEDDDEEDEEESMPIPIPKGCCSEEEVNLEKERIIEVLKANDYEELLYTFGQRNGFAQSSVLNEDSEGSIYREL
ncbi:ribosomal RNA small subunit methyltransferase, mitochondrial isoform X2 [Euphorbia lathyris]|uniref:ribosomal RNA small subunit methyltransferase, mitochondrial isoform X2 n=1 Tax=Euphorbia lathyris TaxID=212925 RepID=UPI003313D666